MAWVKETAVLGGTVKMRPVRSGLPFTPVGLCSSVQQAHETSELRLEDATNPLGGTYDKLEKITAMTIALNFREIFSRNLAVMLYGTVHDVAADQVTGEQHQVAVGGTCKLEKMPLAIDTISSATDPLIEFIEDVDYMLTGAGFEVLAGGDLEAAIIAAGPEPYLVTTDYSSAEYDEIEALTDSGQEWELMFEGSNAVGTKGKVNAHYWIARFGLAESLDFISVDDFMAQQVTAEILADPSRGQGKSQYMKINKQKNVPVAP